MLRKDNMEQEQIQNGDHVFDIITKLEGVVTGIAEYITGCRQCLVTPEVADKNSEPRWFDEDRLRHTGNRQRLVLRQSMRATPKGSDIPAPIR